MTARIAGRHSGADVHPGFFQRLLTTFLLWTAVAHAATNSIPGDVFVLRRFDWIPPFRQFRVVPVKFPDKNPMMSVESLASTGDRLWIAARPWTDTNLPPRSGKLWTFRPAENRIDPVTGALEVHSASAMLPQGGKLWLTLNGGLATLDVNTYTVDPFGAPQGMTSPTPVGIAETRRGLFALGDAGVLFKLSPDQKTFLRFEEPAPVPDSRDPSPWRFFAGSGDWVLAASEATVAFRHADAPRWSVLHDALKPRAPEMYPATVSSVAGGTDGRFWIGSDAGLWSIQADNGAVESREYVGSVMVPGGLGFKVAPGMKATESAVESARQRVIDGIRERMKLRARHARTSRETNRRIDPVTPRSKIPGPVLALAEDHGFLWVATTDPLSPLRSRVLLFHPGSRKWVGWFPIGFPIRTLATDNRYIWIGVDSRPAPMTPLFAVEKAPLLAIPAAKWTPDELDQAEVAGKVAALPARERAVFAFFSGDYAAVSELTDPSTANDELLFLRAVNYDPIGLDLPARLSESVEQLRTRFPDSLFTSLATNLVARAVAVAPIASPEVTPQPAAQPAAPASAADVMLRRDLNGDSRLNIVELRLWLGPTADIAKWDRNNDGAIDAEEIKALIADNPDK